MTILKNKLQKQEFKLRKEKIKKISFDNVRIHNEMKSCQNEMKVILQEYGKDFNPDKFHISLSKDNRKCLQRNGVLVEYLNLSNSYYHHTDVFHSNLRKIKRIHSVDFPDY